MRPKSKHPRKQRKYNANVPRHDAHKLVSANLSPELRKSKGFRSLPVKVGDTVSIMRGKYKGRSGKISRVAPDRQLVFIDKVTRGKSDKSEIAVPIHASNLMITKYETRKDKWRMTMINRRIKDESEKIDIESVLAEIEAEEDEAIDFDDALDDEELLEEEAEVILDEDLEEEEEE